MIFEATKITIRRKITLGRDSVFRIAPRVAFFILTLGAPACAQSPRTLSSVLAEIDTRPGVTQKFILIKPANPIASVILFAGRNGNLRLSSNLGKPFMRSGSTDFLVRTREEYARHGMMVAVVDAPSDQNWKKGINITKKEKECFRLSAEHTRDIKAVAAYLKREAHIPVWLIGTSWGTVSATNGATRIKEGIDGLVLISAMTRAHPKWQEVRIERFRQGVLTMALDEITLPTLIVYHMNDECYSTPAEDAPKIKERLTQSRKTEIFYFTGGREASSDSCGPMSNHGFLGIEKRVVAAITQFIKTNEK